MVLGFNLVAVTSKVGPTMLNKLELQGQLTAVPIQLFVLPENFASWMETLVAWGFHLVHAKNKQIVLISKILCLLGVFHVTQNETESRGMYKTKAY